MSDAKITLTAEDRTKVVIAGLKASLGQVQTKGEELNTSFGKLGGVLASAFVGLSFTAFIKSTAAGIDALNDIKDATGASISNISALEDVAMRTGTTLDVVTGSLVKLNQTLNAAEPGNPQARAFEAIGLSAEALKKVDPAEALRLTAVALTRYADDGNKARLVQEMFGKSIREVAPFLNDLATQTKLVGTVTEAQAIEAEKFNKQLSELSKNSVDLARNLTSTLLPAINGLFDKARNKGVVGGIAAMLGFDDKFFETKALADAGAKMRDLQSERVLLEEMLRGDYTNADTPNRRTRLDQIVSVELPFEIAQYKQAAALIQGLRPQDTFYSNEGKFAPKPSVKIADKATTPPAEKISEAQTALAAYVKTLQDQIDKTEQLTDKQKTLDLLRSLGANGQVPQVRELVLGMEQRLTLARQDEAIQASITRELDAQAKASQELDQTIYEYSGRLEDARKIAETTRLEAQLAAGVQYSPEELEKIVKRIAGIKDEVKPELDAMDEMFKQFARNTQDALGNTIEQSLKGNFDNIGSLWGDLLLKMASQALAAKVGQDLFGDLFKGGDLGGLAKLGASFFGIPGFAAGGSHSGGLRIVGENGPELESTGPARLYTAGQTAQMLSGAGRSRQAVTLTYAPSIQIDSRADRSQAVTDAQAVMAQGQRDMLAMLHAKGVL